MSSSRGLKRFSSLFISATALSQAGRISVALRSLEGRTVSIAVWGAPLPGASKGTFRVRSIRGFGAGLLLWLQPASGGPSTLLKVAQPKSVRQDPQRVEIPDAAYVQWAGARVRRREGAAAFTLSVTA